MSQIPIQIQQQNNKIAALQAAIQGSIERGLLYTLAGDYVVFGCRITEGVSASDMYLALDGQASGDTDHLNPDLYYPAQRTEEYPNIALAYGRAFLSENINKADNSNESLKLEDAPSTSGFNRYDIVYIYVNNSGPAIGIATGTASNSITTLSTADYPTTGDPTLVHGCIPIARIFVATSVSGISNSNIHDLRNFTGRLRGEKGDMKELTDGTASAPAVAFASDPNTGIYRIGADNLGIACNGAKVVDVGTSGMSVTGSAKTTSHALIGLASGSAWSTGKALELGYKGVGLFTTADTQLLHITNAYFSGGWKYAGSGACTSYEQTVSSHIFSYANAGTADSALTFAEIARLNSTGLTVTGSVSATGQIRSSTAGIVCTGSAATTYNYMQVVGSTTAAAYQYVNTTGGYLRLGVESSTGGTIVNGASSYSGFITTVNATNFFVGVNNSAVAQFSSTGLTVTGTIKGSTTVGVGNATPAASGAGITFPATQSASSDPNTLDDYEEGTWTPAAANITITNEVTATYTKVGRQVTCHFAVLFPTTADTSDLYFTGLPFTSAGIYTGVSIGQTSYTTPFTGAIAASESKISWYTFGNSPITNNALSGKRIRGSVTYQV